MSKKAKRKKHGSRRSTATPVAARSAPAAGEASPGQSAPEADGAAAELPAARAEAPDEDAAEDLGEGLGEGLGGELDDGPANGPDEAADEAADEVGDEAPDEEADPAEEAEGLKSEEPEEARAEAPAEAPSAPPRASRPRRSARTPGARRRRRPPTLRFKITSALLAGGAVVGLAGGLWSVPTVRTQLLDSFTQRGASFTELYFTADPSYEGASVVVPLAVTDHGTGASSYQIKVTLESPDGSDAGTDTVKLVPKDGAPVPVVVRMPSNGSAAMVRVSLVGHPQTLHFHFGKQPTANP